MNFRFFLAWFISVAMITSTNAGPLDDSLLAGAASRLDLKGVEIALRRGAKAGEKLSQPQAPDVRRTPIQFAIRAMLDYNEPDTAQRTEKILLLLFKAGAKVTADKDELFIPIVGGHQKIVQILFDNGANPHLRIYGYSVAELAVKYDQRKLLSFFYSRNVPKVDSETAVQIEFVHGAENQNLSIMKRTFTAGAKVNLPDPGGSFAIVQLFSRPLLEPEGHEALRWLLSEAGADANATNFSEDKNTALHNLIRRNSYRPSDHYTTAVLAEVLLRSGANVSSIDDLERTPLHYAAASGNVLAMQVLLRAGAKVVARDLLRKTPLDLAKSGEAISLLRAAGAKE